MLLVTRIVCTVWRFNRLVANWVVEVWIRPSRCGSFPHNGACCQTKQAKGSALGRLKDTRYVLYPTYPLLHVTNTRQDYVLSVCLTPDGQWVMSGSKDRGVQFWDPNTGNAQMMLQGHKNSVISVAPCPTGHLFATGSGDMKARIWQYGPYR